MSEQDAGEPCIPVGVIERHIEQGAMYGNVPPCFVASCSCAWGADRAVDTADAAHAQWVAHLAALAQAAGTASAAAQDAIALDLLTQHEYWVDPDTGESTCNDCDACAWWSAESPTHDRWLAFVSHLEPFALAPAQGTAGALPAAVVALLCDLQRYVESTMSAQPARQSDASALALWERIGALLTGQPDAEGQ